MSISTEEKEILAKAKRSIARNGMDVYFTSKLPLANPTIAKLLFEDNKDLVEPAIKINPSIFEMFGYDSEDPPSSFDWICADERLITIYSRWPDSSAQYIHPDYLINHLDLIGQYLHNDPTSYRWMDKRVRRDLMTAIMAVKLRGDNLEHVPEDMRHNQTLVDLASRKEPLGLHFAPEKVRKDPRYVKTALETNPAYLVTLLKTNKDLANNYELLKPVILKDMSMMQYVSPLMDSDKYAELLISSLKNNELKVPKIENKIVLFSDKVLPTLVKYKLHAAIEMVSVVSNSDPEIMANFDAKINNVLKKSSQETLYVSWSAFLEQVKGKHIGGQLEIRIDKVFNRLTPYLSADTVTKMLDNLKMPSYTNVIARIKDVIEKKRIEEIKQTPELQKDVPKKPRKMLP